MKSHCRVAGSGKCIERWMEKSDIVINSCSGEG